MSTKLAQQTQKTAGIPNGMRTATIAAVSGSAVTISVAGGQFSSGVGVLGSYTPVVGDTVAVFRQDSSWLILGSISAAGVFGRVGTAMVIANSSTFTAITVVASLTVNMVAGLTYGLTWEGRISTATTAPATEFALVRIKLGTTTAGADLNVTQVALPNNSSAGWASDLYAEYTAPSTGATSFVATISGQTTPVVTLGGLALRASPTGPAFLRCDYVPGGGIYQ